MGSKKYKGKPCIYCVDGISGDGEHIISRKFFPEKFRGSLPKAPSCKQCNELNQYCNIIRECPGCGAPFQDQCGQLWYSIPKCLSCGSLLEIQDMDSDTAETCCGKGKRKTAAENLPQPFLEDDIPF